MSQEKGLPNEDRVSPWPLYRVALACGPIFAATVAMPDTIAKALRRELEEELESHGTPFDHSRPVTAVGVSPLAMPMSPTQFLQAAAEMVIDVGADDPAERQLRRSFFRHQDEALRLEQRAHEVAPDARLVIELRFVREFGGPPHDRLIIQRVAVNPLDGTSAHRWVTKVKNALEKAGAAFVFDISNCVTPERGYDRVRGALNALADQLLASQASPRRAPHEDEVSVRRPVSRQHPWAHWLRTGVGVALSQTREDEALAQEPVARRARPRS